VRTLVISDLHLGSRLEHDVLTRPEPLRRLLSALRGVERLVLLGDTVELAEGRPQHALQVAAPVLGAIGAALGPAREVVIVPGNHDRAFVRGWVRRKGAALGTADAVPLGASPALARMTVLLAPARVRVHYPGFWLSGRVWATHGHYLDRHLIPESAIGMARGLLGRRPRDLAVPAEYESAQRPSFTRATRWMPRPLAALVDNLAELVRAATAPRVPWRLLHRRMAPMLALVLGAQMQGASIPALARVVHRLGIDAEWVVFGHVHRLGPLPADDPEKWRGPGGGPRIANTGSWLYEPLLVHRARMPHPYWPGGAVLLQDDADPQVLGLLNELPETDLR
jgi:hypothetical protein